MRLLFLFTALLLLTSGLTRAGEIDRACSENGGMSSPKGGGGLKILTSCVKSYCKSTTKTENTRDNIKFVDETLASYHQRNEKFSAAVGTYQSACRVLMKKFCQACPLKDAVISAVLRVQMTNEELEESARLVRAQENFGHFARVVSSEESDLACGSQIIALAEKAIRQQNDMTSRFANTTCDK